MAPAPPAALRDFELLVLLAVLGLKDDAYPVSIRDAIEQRTGRAPSRAAVFITLERLQEKGLVTSTFGDPTPVRGGRAKRFFRATRSGIAAAQQAVDQVSAMTAGLDAVLKRR
ncbi:MAG TPA: PadR family transcriptional regulator [Vicinamibacterales bacterium]|nr:PadR family transcriptional regulator [Vicinamibacterales bacterium]